MPPGRGNSIAQFVKGPLAIDCDLARRAINLLNQSSVCKEVPSRVNSGFSPRKFVIEATGDLFDYQRESISMVDEIKSKGGRSALLSLPTGGGKTRTALSFLLNNANMQSNMTFIWVAPSIELVEQAEHDLLKLSERGRLNDVLNVYVNYIPTPSDLKRHGNTIIFVTVGLFLSRRNKIFSLLPNTLVFDEAHLAAGDVTSDVLDEVMKNSHCFVLGLSATPGRLDESKFDTLREVFSGNLVVPHLLGVDPVSTLRERQVLANLNIKRIFLPPDSDHITQLNSRGFAVRSKDLALDRSRFWALFECVKSVSSTNQCLVFCESVAHAQALDAVLQVSGVKSSVVSHLDDPGRRSELVSQFRRGELQVLLNKSLLVAGFDVPKLNNIVLGTPIRSPIQWEQMIGRVSRGVAVGGSENSYIWELDEHVDLHGKVMSAMRYSLDF